MQLHTKSYSNDFSEKSMALIISDAKFHFIFNALVKVNIG